MRLSSSGETVAAPNLLTAIPAAKLIEQISPDILVKGGDYTVEQIAGAEHVLRHGGKVEVLEFLDGCSTSKVISKIKQ